MNRKAILLLITCFATPSLAVACAPSSKELDAHTSAVARTAKTQESTPTPTTASPTPAPTPVIPTSFESVEELILLFDYDLEAALDFDQDPDSVQVFDISYVSPLGGRVTGYLVVPPGEGPFAGIVYMHGAQGSRSTFLGEAMRVARMGIVSILIDGLPSRPEPWQREVTTSDLAEYRASQIQTIIDLRRAVDVLISRPDVDPNRIGFVGHSYGAILGGVLAGVEQRIKVYVLMAGYPKFIDAMPPESRTEEFMQMMDPIDPIHYIGHAAPSTIFFQYGFYDQSIPPEIVVEYTQNVSELKRVKYYHAGHMLDTQSFFDRAEWLASQLDLDTTTLYGPGE